MDTNPVQKKFLVRRLFSEKRRNEKKPFDPAVFDTRKNPSGFYDFVTIDKEADYLQGATSIISDNTEIIKTGFANFNFPLLKRNNISLDFKVGGKVINTEKERNYDEKFFKNYYLTPNSFFTSFMKSSSIKLK